jgi:LPXTG-motif cell wall-anchored protein
VPTPKPVALAFTGANVAVPVGIMLTLLAIGFALLLVQRRRKRS